MLDEPPLWGYILMALSVPGEFIAFLFLGQYAFGRNPKVACAVVGGTMAIFWLIAFSLPLIWHIFWASMP